MSSLGLPSRSIPALPGEKRALNLRSIGVFGHPANRQYKQDSYEHHDDHCCPPADRTIRRSKNRYKHCK